MAREDERVTAYVYSVGEEDGTPPRYRILASADTEHGLTTVAESPAFTQSLVDSQVLAQQYTEWQLSPIHLSDAVTDYLTSQELKYEMTLR